MSIGRRMLLLVSLGLILTACGGGGGGGDAIQAQSSAAPAIAQTATVGVLLTDARGPRWDQALATITSIELIGESHQATLFSGRETIDLLRLTDYSELFTVAEGIEPGEFTTIRVLVERLELVARGDSGAEKRVDAALVGDGKIDVGLRAPHAIAGGDVLLVEIDFDMRKSFDTLETRNGQTTLRPVVHASVKTNSDFMRLTRIAGTVEEVEEGGQGFVLCRTALAANFKRRNHDDDGKRRCIPVTTDDATGVFGADGLPVATIDILVDDELTAVGFLRRDADDDDADDGRRDDHWDDLVLEAVTLELGEEFGRFSGVVAGDVTGDVFDFTLASGQGFAPDTLVSTQLFPTTRIFSDTGIELDQLSIVPDANAIIDGIITLDGGEADNLLRAALIVIAADAEAAEEILRGEIVSVAAEAGTLQLLVDTMDRCVNANSADIFLISDDDGLVSERGELAELVAGQRADVYGTEGVDGCFVASDILVDARE